MDEVGVLDLGVGLDHGIQVQVIVLRDLRGSTGGVARGGSGRGAEGWWVGCWKLEREQEMMRGGK